MHDVHQPKCDLKLSDKFLSLSLSMSLLLDVPFPPTLNSSAVNETTLYLSWTRSFTWDSHPITSYSIIVLATSALTNSRTVLANLTVGPTVSSYTLSEIISCSELIVTTRARNEIGWSLPNILMTGLPQSTSEI